MPRLFRPGSRVIPLFAALFTLMAISTPSEARRLGGGGYRSSSSSHSTSGGGNSSALGLQLYRNSGASSNQSSYSGANYVPLAVGAGAVAGAAVARGRQPVPLSPEEEAKRAAKHEEEMRIARLEDEARRDMAERAKAERALRQDIAALQKEKEFQQLSTEEQKLVAQRRKVDRERQCKIEPVMTDAQIALCKEVWR